MTIDAIQIVAFITFLGGAFAAVTVCFLRWRFRKEVVRASHWKRFMDDFRSMEETVDATARTEHQVRLAYEDLTHRLRSVVTEKEQLHDKLTSLQTDLAVVTNEATLLVDGLRDNEERWSSVPQPLLWLYSVPEQYCSDLHQWQRQRLKWSPTGVH